MPSDSKHEVVLVRYPFSDLTSAKVRPAIVINAPHVSQDLFVVSSRPRNNCVPSPSYSKRRVECGLQNGGTMSCINTLVSKR